MGATPNVESRVLLAFEVGNLAQDDLRSHEVGLGFHHLFDVLVAGRDLIDQRGGVIVKPRPTIHLTLQVGNRVLTLGR